ncbi:hypothetical protein [Cupriavidus pauculus]|uniref:hypothetical protein n=1 Tax=Cupriavidus pauculus TaxID=82633 RepID=UPI003857D71D
MKNTRYFIVLGVATAAFSLSACDKKEAGPVSAPQNAELKDYREIYQKDEVLAQRDWAECKKSTGRLTDQCRMARQYGQQVYKAPEPGFSSQGGSK